MTKARAVTTFVTFVTFAALVVPGRETVASAQQPPQLPPPPPPPTGQTPPAPARRPVESSGTQGGGSSSAGTYRGRAAAASPAPVERAERDDAAGARTGFQLALRTGIAVPMGSVRDGASMGDALSTQLPILVDVGAKVHPNVFVGGYVGVSVGGAAGAAHRVCNAANESCTSHTFVVGIEGQYHFRPATPVNPWVGYGIGLESSGVGYSKNGDEYRLSFSGLQFARLDGGVDFRLSRTVGVGPFVDLAFGRYGSETTVANRVTVDDDIARTALHTWLTLGVRVVFFP